MDDQKELDLNRLVTTLGENRLSFGSAERLADRATIFIGTKDLLAFLGGLGAEYRTIEV